MNLWKNFYCDKTHWSLCCSKRRTCVSYITFDRTEVSLQTKSFLSLPFTGQITILAKNITMQLLFQEETAGRNFWKLLPGGTFVNFPRYTYFFLYRFASLSANFILRLVNKIKQKLFALKMKMCATVSCSDAKLLACTSFHFW